MEDKQRVILYGDSLILEGVHSSLDISPNVEVIALNQPPADLFEELRALHPAAMIFDLSSVTADFPLAILHQSDLILIGIDPETHQAFVWSGRQLCELSTSELVQVIHAERRGDAVKLI